MPVPEGSQLDEIRQRRAQLRDKHLRDPNGVGIELSDERLGVFAGEPLVEYPE